MTSYSVDTLVIAWTDDWSYIYILKGSAGHAVRITELSFDQDAWRPCGSFIKQERDSHFPSGK